MWCCVLYVDPHYLIVASPNCVSEKFIVSNVFRDREETNVRMDEFEKQPDIF